MRENPTPLMPHDPRKYAKQERLKAASGPRSLTLRSNECQLCRSGARDESGGSGHKVCSVSRSTLATRQAARGGDKRGKG